jgi:hypothetical protein
MSNGVVWFILVCAEREREKKRKKEITIHASKYI